MSVFPLVRLGFHLLQLADGSPEGMRGLIASVSHYGVFLWASLNTSRNVRTAVIVAGVIAIHRRRKPPASLVPGPGQVARRSR